MTPREKSEGDIKPEKTEELNEMINCIKTFRYLDKNLLCCKICSFMTEGRDQIERHVLIFHIQPKRRMSERDIVIDYLN